MPEKTAKQNINSIVSKLFELAASKMKDDNDKVVLSGLRKYLAVVEEDLY